MPRQLQKVQRVALVFVLVLVACLVLGRTVVWLTSRQMDFSVLATQAKPTAAAVESARHAVQEQSEKCRITIDESSLGNADQETEMRALANRIRIYQTKFGKVPRNIDDLQALSESRTDASVGNLRQKYWFKYEELGGGVVIGRDDWKPSAEDLADVTARAGRVQRFFKIGEHELLYVPRSECP